MYSTQSRRASKEVPSLLSCLLGDLDGEPAGGDQSPGSSMQSSKRANCASTFLEKGQGVNAGAHAEDRNLGLWTGFGRQDSAGGGGHPAVGEEVSPFLLPQQCPLSSQHLQHGVILELTAIGVWGMRGQKQNKLQGVGSASRTLVGAPTEEDETDAHRQRPPGGGWPGRAHLLRDDGQQQARAWLQLQGWQRLRSWLVAPGQVCGPPQLQDMGPQAAGTHLQQAARP